MTKLNDRQERLLQNVAQTRDQVQPNLDRLQEEYELADYRAKSPVRDAIETAQEEGVPFRRIQEVMGFSYPEKLKNWMRLPDSATKRLLAGDVPAQASKTFVEVIDSVKTVVRDSHSGVFTVHYNGHPYQVASSGPNEEAWSSADPAIPQGVYDLIKKEFPTWELLEEDD